MPKPSFRCRYCGKRCEQTAKGSQPKKKFCCGAHRAAFGRSDGVRLIEVQRCLKKILPGLIDRRIERAVSKFLKENPVVRDKLNHQIMKGYIMSEQGATFRE